MNPPSEIIHPLPAQRLDRAGLCALRTFQSEDSHFCVMIRSPGAWGFSNPTFVSVQTSNFIPRRPAPLKPRRHPDVSVHGKDGHSLVPVLNSPKKLLYMLHLVFGHASYFAFSVTRVSTPQIPAATRSDRRGTSFQSEGRSAVRAPGAGALAAPRSTRQSAARRIL